MLKMVGLIALLLTSIWISALAQDEVIVIQDSCLNTDTLAIETSYFQPGAGDEDNLGKVIIENFGNRSLVLEYSRYRFRNDLAFGFWQYYFRILGVMVGKTVYDDGKMICYYVKLKSNNYLRSKIPKTLKQNRPQMKFRWN